VLSIVVALSLLNLPRVLGAHCARVLIRSVNFRSRGVFLKGAGICFTKVFTVSRLAVQTLSTKTTEREKKGKQELERMHAKVSDDTNPRAVV